MKNLLLVIAILSSLALAACNKPYPTRTFTGPSGWPSDQKPIER